MVLHHLGGGGGWGVKFKKTWYYHLLGVIRYVYG